MLRVTITAQLIEQTLRSGNKIGSLLEVIEGLPFNAQLVDAKVEGGYLRLFFAQSTVPNTEIVDVNISVKARSAVAIEDLERAKKKEHLNSGIVVERNIG
jgi:hypothetical protein